MSVLLLVCRQNLFWEFWSRCVPTKWRSVDGKCDYPSTAVQGELKHGPYLYNW